jgi:thiamine-phosphate pyrophosphorylase
MKTNSQSKSVTAREARVRFARGMAVHDPGLRLYAILDAESCTRRGLDLFQTASAFASSGIRLVQYRDKLASEITYLQNARALRERFPPDTLFLLNDYAHLVDAAGADGVHIGQDDGSVAEARERIGTDRVLGVSTHSADQALATSASEADYVAIGPVFSTASKQGAEPTVGVCGVQAARAVTQKPLVAIGGITPGAAQAVFAAGADAIAMIGALLPPAGEDVGAHVAALSRMLVPHG